MTIVKAAPEDGPAILRISAAVGVFSRDEVACVRELWEDYLTRGDAGDYLFIVRRDQDKVLGFVCYGRKALTEGAWDLYWLAVDPAAHGRGVGRALVKHTEAEVLARGGYLLLIETSMTPAYAAARRLYESCGYIREAVIRDFYARGDDLALYSKHLA
jgi:ribosomal protein S18 acetylase RimI-like enzyme